MTEENEEKKTYEISATLVFSLEADSEDEAIDKFYEELNKNPYYMKTINTDIDSY